MIIGVGGAVLVALAPTFLSEQAAPLPAMTPGTDPSDIDFVFPQLLPESEVPVDLDVYGDPTAPVRAIPREQREPRERHESVSTPSRTPRERTPPQGTAAPAKITEIFIQAASFRNVSDAEQLRARLLLQGLPVRMGQVALQNGTWHRVIVGPVDSTREANKIMSRLRQQNLSAIRINVK